jgi:uncharacterized iron-regulated protein
MYFQTNPGRRSTAKLCPIWAVLLLIAACTTAGRLIGSSFPPANPVELRIGDVVETANGNVISMDELTGRLSKVSVVYVGETHTSTEDHRIQLAVLEKLTQAGRCVELGMEMFPANTQTILDRYIRGEMSEQDFLKEAGWDDVWRFPYSLYRDLVNWQKERHRGIVGLNAPDDVVKKIAHNGLDSLTADERSQVAREFHLEDPANRERIRKEYTEHEKLGIKDFESFFEAQLAWEETMAQTLAQRLPTGPGCIIVVAIGKGHISGRLGVPYLARLRKPHEYTTVAPVPIDYPLGTVDPDLADYVIITDKSKPFQGS